MILSKRLGTGTLPDSWRFFLQSQITRNLTQDHKLVFRRHLVEPKTEKYAKNYEIAYRAFWKIRRDRLANIKLGRWSKEPVKNYHKPAPRQDVSATQKWLTAAGSAARMVPRDLPQVKFPAGEITFIPPSPAKTPKRTDEDRRRAEAVLELPMTPLAKYVSPEMIGRIKESPYYVHDKDAMVLRCHQHSIQGANKRQLFKNVSVFLRNVAQEIVYRESMWNIDNLRVVLVSEDESKAMAWNLKKSFTLQIKQRHKQEAKGEGKKKKKKKASILQVQQRQREEVESEREAKTAITFQLKLRKNEEAEVERKERKKEKMMKKREAKRAMNPSASVILGHPERD